MRYKGRNLGGVCFPRTPSFLGFPPRSPPHPRFARVRRLATLNPSQDSKIKPFSFLPFFLLFFLLFSLITQDEGYALIIKPFFPFLTRMMATPSSTYSFHPKLLTTHFHPHFSHTLYSTLSSTSN